MAQETISLNGVYEYNGSLASLNDTLLVSSFGAETSGELTVDDTDGGFDFDPGETATWDEGADGGATPATYVGGGTAVVGVDLPLLGTVTLADSAEVYVYESGGSSWFHYPDQQPSELLNGLATQLLTDPLIGTVTSLLGIDNTLEGIVGYLETDAALTVDLQTTTARRNRRSLGDPVRGARDRDLYRLCRTLAVRQSRRVSCALRE